MSYYIIELTTIFDITAQNRKIMLLNFFQRSQDYMKETFSKSAKSIFGKTFCSVSVNRQHIVAYSFLCNNIHTDTFII